MKYHFIVNPTSGNGRGRRLFEEAKAILDKKNIKYTYSLSEYAGHSKILAKEAYENGERIIIAVGGDGTVSEVASQIVNTDAVFGIFPFGTGNDLAHTLNIPVDAEGAVNVLIEGKPKKIDTATANDRFFINVSGFGFDTDVVINTEKFKKRFSGIFPYLFGVLQAMLHLKKLPVKIKADGKCIETDCLLIAFGNGKYFGGGMMVAPEAEISDGKIDVCVVNSINTIKFLTLLPKFIKGKHLKYDKIITYFKAESVEVECAVDRVINYDGELDSRTPVSVRLLKNSLNTILPNN